MTEAAMIMPAKNQRRGPRGWLLIEVTIGGIMASVILGALLVNVGDAMDRSSVVGRKLTAQMLAKQGIEQARAITNPVVNLPDSSGTLAVPASLQGTYTRTRTITSGSTVVGGLTVRFVDVAVTVTFPQKSGTKSVSLQTRLE